MRCAVAPLGRAKRDQVEARAPSFASTARLPRRAGPFLGRAYCASGLRTLMFARRDEPKTAALDGRFALSRSGS